MRCQMQPEGAGFGDDYNEWVHSASFIIIFFFNQGQL